LLMLKRCIQYNVENNMLPFVCEVKEQLERRFSVKEIAHHLHTDIFQVMRAIEIIQKSSKIS